MRSDRVWLRSAEMKKPRPTARDGRGNRSQIVSDDGISCGEVICNKKTDAQNPRRKTPRSSAAKNPWSFTLALRDIHRNIISGEPSQALLQAFSPMYENPVLQIRRLARDGWRRGQAPACFPGTATTSSQSNLVRGTGWSCISAESRPPRRPPHRLLTRLQVLDKLVVPLLQHLTRWRCSSAHVDTVSQSQRLIGFQRRLKERAKPAIRPLAVPRRLRE